MSSMGEVVDLGGTKVLLMGHLDTQLGGDAVRVLRLPEVRGASSHRTAHSSPR